jgi:predicted RNA binding protein YcfA (HicA-like mRNA interferase family)
MPKASRVLAALKRAGWVEIRRSGSHRTLEKDGIRRRWAIHDGADLGTPMMARLADMFGYSLDGLRRIL